ncbi:kynurenine formamidase [Sabethes cyaneus]|uniref:kynurenine formamidase n=1 Tax=Sabethes cyaneus TaxID=53552 RepID=UPI00237E5FB5|nr:kynurenine formamidase [Sabethes cyaneus]
MDTPSAEQIAIWEKEYSPSEWNRRFPSAEQVIEYHVQFVTEVSDQYRRELKCTLNVAYGPGKHEKIDIYGDDLPKDAPLLVYIHGGYWQMLSKNDSAYCAKPLVENGFRVIIVDYDLCPDVTLSEQVKQVKRAVQFIINNAAENNVNDISLAGHSAGAHLIATSLDGDFLTAAGSGINLIKHLYLISGVYVLEELRHTKAVNTNNLLDLDQFKAISLSPLHLEYAHLTGLNLKVHLYVAENDSNTFKHMSMNMCKHIQNYGIESSVQILPGLDHFDIVEKLSEENFVIIRDILKNSKVLIK